MTEPDSTTSGDAPRQVSLENCLDLLLAHERQAAKTLNMVPAENSMSALAKLPMLLDVYHRYFFNTSQAADEWNFRGSQDVAVLETGLTLELLRELTGAKYVNLRPLSGLHAMTVVLSALGGEQGSTVLTVSPDQGGHYATQSLARRLGYRTQFITGPDPHTLDYAGIGEKLLRFEPDLVYVDQSNCLFPLDVEQLVDVVRSVRPETRVHVDCSHWLGFVFGRVFPNPLQLGADSFGGSTHKSFPGPQKAIVATNSPDISEIVYQAQFEMISSHHFAASICLGIALLEFKECGGREYAQNILENTLELGRQLDDRGIEVVARDKGYSRGHQLWIDTALMGIDAYAASDRLYEAGIRVNAFPGLPGIDRRVIRIGLNEATYHGLQKTDMSELAEIFDAAVRGSGPAGKLADRVAALRNKYDRPHGFRVSHERLQGRIINIIAEAMQLPGGLQLDHVAAVRAFAK